MVYAYFGLVNPSPGFFWLATNFGGGGGGKGLLEPPMIRPPKLLRVIYSLFPTFRHNWTDTIAIKYLGAIMTSYCRIYGKNPNSINFLVGKNRNKPLFYRKKRKKKLKNLPVEIRLPWQHQFSVHVTTTVKCSQIIFRKLR